MGRMVNDKPYCKNCRYNKGFAGCKARECPYVDPERTLTIGEAVAKIEGVISDLLDRLRSIKDDVRLKEMWQIRDWLKELQDLREKEKHDRPDYS